MVTGLPGGRYIGKFTFPLRLEHFQHYCRCADRAATAGSGEPCSYAILENALAAQLALSGTLDAQVPQHFQDCFSRANEAATKV